MLVSGLWMDHWSIWIMIHPTLTLVIFYKNDFYKKQGSDSADLLNRIKNTLLKIWGWADLGSSYKKITSVDKGYRWILFELSHK